MESTIKDAAIFFKKEGDKLFRLCATYVDDALHTGKQEYFVLSKKTEEKFQCRACQGDNVQFASVQIETNKNENAIHQKRFMTKFGMIAADADYHLFRSMRAKLD